MPARPNGVACFFPSGYTSDEQAKILHLVREGGEVAVTPEGIKRARTIATAWVDGRMVGVAALKSP